MSVITKETVEHVAKLARLELDESEVERYTQDLSRILDLIDQLNRLDLSRVELHLAPEHETLFREDAVAVCRSHEMLLKNAPHEEDGFFRVPKILDESNGTGKVGG